MNKWDDKTRRQILLGGLAAVGGIAAVSGAKAQDKLDPKLVQYQTTPNDGKKCSECVNFEPPNACKFVTGVISPNGWCVAFAPKDS